MSTEIPIPGAAIPGLQGRRASYRGANCMLAIAEANRALSALRVRKALDIYTCVLEANNGHIVAFLNRSLCYLLLGYPTLAVADAHRAVLAINHTMNSSTDTLDARTHLYNMWLFVREADPELDSWTTGPNQYAGAGRFPFLNVPLASLTIEPEPERGPESCIVDEATPIKRTSTHLLRNVWLKAYYRLAVALWQCGGGAWQSAVDQIDIVRDMNDISRDDISCFRKLWERIDTDASDIITEEAFIHSFLKHRGLEPIPPGSCIRSLIRSRFTKAKREAFPWDRDSLVWVDTHSPIPLDLSMLTESSPVEFFFKIGNGPGASARLALRAKRGIYGNQCLLREDSAFRAVLPRPAVFNYYAEDSGIEELGNITRNLDATESCHYIDWSYDTSVRLPYEAVRLRHAGRSESDGIEAVFNMNYDGWILETIRMKIDGTMRVRKLPEDDPPRADGNPMDIRHYHMNKYLDPMWTFTYGEYSHERPSMGAIQPLIHAITPAARVYTGGVPSVANVKVINLGTSIEVVSQGRIMPGEVLVG
ncbi:hypothetical protein BU24DRAFT_491926 [Aaosphaeria arxii CBS 175.79]|uniref:EF-hand domain-containing protein n=1 Tax=Aaosphaeria arxii CBS 175.79 TaxID=1450172 RepID=A0A6A5XSH3_9PLEO|nr:uncharacterized protein BU24DRAFT_491926 [Aaosphaeria arxii CBS 175.79]KAF2015711.1 hypothetical protein BU24DRAFT_491926 [Aaosphaeria arxii CBS 175.79]